MILHCEIEAQFRFAAVQQILDDTEFVEMIAVKKVDLFPPRHLSSLQKKPYSSLKKGDLLNSQKTTSCVTFPRKGAEDLFALNRTLSDHVSTVSKRG